MSAIRVLHIVGAMNRGGAETLIMELYRHIDRTRVQFDFLVYNYSDKPGDFDEEILSLGGKIFEAKRRLYKGPIRYCLELKNFFDSHPEYRIVHAHKYATSGYILEMAKRSGSRVTIAHSHSAFVMTDFFRRFTDAVGKKLLKKNADFFFGCSEDALISLNGSNSNNTSRFVIKNAVDPKKFEFSQYNREKWRKEFGADNDTFIMGNVARFTYEKNHEHLVRVFAEVKKRKNNSLLVLVGDGGEKQKIEELVKELSVSEKVIFMGIRKDVHEILNAFDVFVMPSRFEGLGIVLIEAQANGLHCVISSDVIPQEADVNAGLVTRVKLSDTPEEWAESCLNVRKRLAPIDAQVAVRDAGYDIKEVTKWLQDFYISHWSE